LSPNGVYRPIEHPPALMVFTVKEIALQGRIPALSAGANAELADGKQVGSQAALEDRLSGLR